MQCENALEEVENFIDLDSEVSKLQQSAFRFQEGNVAIVNALEVMFKRCSETLIQIINLVRNKTDLKNRSVCRLTNAATAGGSITVVVALERLDTATEQWGKPFTEVLEMALEQGNRDHLV